MTYKQNLLYACLSYTPHMSNELVLQTLDLSLT
jgi:hypothetical protein